MPEMPTLSTTKLAAALYLAIVAAPAGLVAQHEDHARHFAEHHPEAEAAAVERAALDYLEGFYEGDPDKIRRGVHPDVVKHGFFREGGEAPYQGMAMSFAQMIEFANGVREREDYPDASAPKEVHLLDVQDQTAAVKVVAWWGQDYLQLAKYAGEWKVIHVLWQSLSQR